MTAKLYDPKLKQVAVEIRAVLEKHDVGAFVTLTSPTHSEFVMHLPSWSGLSLENDDQGKPRLRIRIKKEEKQKAEATVWMVAGSIEILHRGIKQYGTILDFMRQKALIKLPGDRECTPHSPEMDPC